METTSKVELFNEFPVHSRKGRLGKLGTMSSPRWLLRESISLIYQSFIYATSFLPKKWAFEVARRVGSFRYRARRNVIELHPQLAEGTSSEQLTDWVKRSFELATFEDMEYCLYPRIRKDNLTDLIRISGLERLEVALNEGKGAILYSGHIRGYFTFCAALGLLGYKPNVVGLLPGWGHNPIERSYLERRNRHMREKCDCRFLSAESSNFGVAAQALNALRRNEVILIAMDKVSAKETVIVRFFGRQQPFPTGPVLLAQTSGAPLLSFFVHYPDGGVPSIGEIGPPFHPRDGLKATLQHCASELEEKILQHPATWYDLWAPEWELWKS